MRWKKMNYRIVNGAISYGAETILEEINFEIKEKEKKKKICKQQIPCLHLLVTGDHFIFYYVAELLIFSIPSQYNLPEPPYS